MDRIIWEKMGGEHFKGFSCKSAYNRAYEMHSYTMVPCSEELNTQYPTSNVQFPSEDFFRSIGYWEFLVGHWTFNCSF